jgi:hypothetical protein
VVDRVGIFQKLGERIFDKVNKIGITREISYVSRMKKSEIVVTQPLVRGVLAGFIIPGSNSECL